MSKAAKKETLPANNAARMAIAMIEKVTGQKPVAANMSTWPHVPTGSMVVDNMIGGNAARDGKGLMCPGFPRKRISEVYGAESCGKTTLAICAAVNVQRAGGTVLYLDFEHALHHGYAQACGLSFDQDKLILMQPITLEEGLKMMLVGIRAGIDLVVIDSVAAMVPKDELEKKLDETAKIGALAKKLSEVLPKLGIWLAGRMEDGKVVEEGKTAVVFINQTRALINTGGHSAETENTAGGKALKFYASLRLKMTKIRSDFIEKKDDISLKKKRAPYGNLVQVKVVKNKLDAKQGETGEVFIRYGFGIDDYLSVIESAAARRIVKKDGSMYRYGEQSFRGRDAFRAFLMKDLATYETLKKQVVDAIVTSSTITASEADEDDIVSADEEALLEELDGISSGGVAEEVIDAE
jgi:recombination protein RecA